MMCAVCFFDGRKLTDDLAARDAELSAMKQRAEAAEALLAKNEGRVKEIVDEQLLARVEAAERKAEEAARDAERYRYLRSRDKDTVFDNDGVKAGVWIDCTDEDGTLQLLTVEDADEAIDAAIAAKGEE